MSQPNAFRTSSKYGPEIKYAYAKSDETFNGSFNPPRLAAMWENWALSGVALSRSVTPPQGSAGVVLTRPLRVGLSAA